MEIDADRFLRIARPDAAPAELRRHRPADRKDSACGRGQGRIDRETSSLVAAMDAAG